MHIEKRVLLAPLTTFGIGGKARFFCHARTQEEVSEAVVFAQKSKVPIFILGGGSNVLISDEGFPGLVIKVEILGIEFIERGNKIEVVAGAGESWDELVRLCVERALHGLENLSGIPGTVGAAPVQNIGAYGVELADFVKWVEVFDARKRCIRRLSRRQCRFGYRDSVFRQDACPLVITSVAFEVFKNGEPNLSYRDVGEYFKEQKIKKPDIAEVREAILEIRGRKFPDLEVVGTAGSFFKNPIVSKAKYKSLKRIYPGLVGFSVGKSKMKLSLAWIIDHACKLKDLRIGDTGVAPRQTLVLCNFGNASAQEVLGLARQIADAVRKDTGIKIEPEVRIVV